MSRSMGGHTAAYDSDVESGSSLSSGAGSSDTFTLKVRCGSQDLRIWVGNP